MNVYVGTKSKSVNNAILKTFPFDIDIIDDYAVCINNQQTYSFKETSLNVLSNLERLYKLLVNIPIGYLVCFSDGLSKIFTDHWHTYIIVGIMDLSNGNINMEQSVTISIPLNIVNESIVRKCHIRTILIEKNPAWNVNDIYLHLTNNTVSYKDILEQTIKVALSRLESQ